jgi:Mg-chelatase subunit ChlI
LNPEKVLEMIPSVVKTAEVARHLDKALLQRLEIRRFDDPSKKRPRGQKVPAEQTDREEDKEEDTDDTDDTDEDKMNKNKINEDEADEDKFETRWRLCSRGQGLETCLMSCLKFV